MHTPVLAYINDIFRLESEKTLRISIVDWPTIDVLRCLQNTGLRKRRRKLLTDIMWEDQTLTNVLGMKIRILYEDIESEVRNWR